MYKRQGVTGYNMRANVAKFTTNQLTEAVKTCHNANVKIYICINTIVKEEDLEELRKLMPVIKSSGADAVIVSDLGDVYKRQNKGSSNFLRF